MSYNDVPIVGQIIAQNISPIYRLFEYISGIITSSSFMNLICCLLASNCPPIQTIKNETTNFDTGGIHMCKPCWQSVVLFSIFI